MVLSQGLTWDVLNSLSNEQDNTFEMLYLESTLQIQHLGFMLGADHTGILCLACIKFQTFHINMSVQII